MEVRWKKSLVYKINGRKNGFSHIMHFFFGKIGI